MKKKESEKNVVLKETPKQEALLEVRKNVCNLNYLSEMMGGKKHLIKEILDAFLKQVPEELAGIEDAIAKRDYITIKNIAHTMKSSVSIMGITVIVPVLNKMEELGAIAADIDEIKELYKELKLICKQAIGEIENEQLKYA